MTTLLDLAVPSFLLLLGLWVVIDEAPRPRLGGMRRALTLLLVPLGILFVYRVGSILLGMLS